MENEIMTMDEIAAEDDAKATAIETEIFALTTRLNELASSDDVTVPAAIEMVRCANRMLNEIVNVESVSELIDEEFALSANVYGQILMVSTREDLTARRKGFLVEVADHMGADYLDWLRRDVAFMVKVDSF